MEEQGEDMSDTYTIRNDELVVSASTLGGALTSVRASGGIEYLWQGDKRYWSGTAPILFPICGSIRNDEATIGSGKRTTMPRHGIVRKREWTLAVQTEGVLAFAFASDDTTRASYPYDFGLRATYTLEGRRVGFALEVENRNAEVMPFFVGVHPGFNCPLMAGEDFGDYYLEFEQVEDCDGPMPMGETGLVDTRRRMHVLSNTRELALSHEMFHKDMVILDELTSRKVRLLSRKSGVGLELDFGGFPYLMLWSSANDGPFIAIEPWTGLSTCDDEDDVFEHKRNVQMLPPGENHTYSLALTIL